MKSMIQGSQKPKTIITEIAVKLGLLVVLCGTMSGVAWAQWSSDPSVNTPICTDSLRQYSPAIYPDNEGGGFIIWSNRSPYDYLTHYGHYAQHINASGVVQWSENGEPLPEVSGFHYYQGNGTFIRFYRVSSTEDCSYYAQRFDIWGNILWPNSVLICSSPGFVTHPQLFLDNNGEVIFTWSDLPRLLRGLYGDIYAQKIDAAGNILWNIDGTPICTQDSSQRSPNVISDGQGGAIFSWHDFRCSDSTWQDIYAQRVDAMGNIMWATEGVPVCTSSFSDYVGGMCSDGNGGVVITYMDSRDAVQTLLGVFGYDLYAQHIDASGNTLWEVPICTVIRDKTRGDIISDGKGGYYISWTDDRHLSGLFGGSGNDIYAQHLDASGNALWEIDGLAICNAYNDQSLPRMFSDGNGGIIIVWEDDRGADIYAQRVDASGNCYWTYDGVAVTTGYRNQFNFSAIPVGTGGALIVWEDLRNLEPAPSLEEIVWNYDIYAQKVCPDGTLGECDCCEITISAPNGYENLCMGEIENISWISQNTSGNVRIDYSTDGGSNWQTEITSTPDDGTHTWTIPNILSSSCLIKISDVADSSCSDQSNSIFEICDTPLAAFNGDPTSDEGMECLVQFTDESSGCITSWEWDFGNGNTSSEQNPNYSFDCDNTYTVSLTVTGPCGSDAEIKTDYITCDCECEIIVTSPNGDEMWCIDGNKEITWNSGYTGSTVLIEYSTDGGTDWQTVVESTPDDGVHPWTIPNTSSTNCLVKVSDVIKTHCSDQSDGCFFICDTPQADFSGDPIISEGISCYVQFTDESNDCITSWNWNFGDGDTSNVQNSSHTFNCDGPKTVRLTVAGPCGSDTETKTDYITCTCMCTISVLSPNGNENWCVGEHKDITWTSNTTSGNVSIEYSTNGGADWNTVKNSTEDNGLYLWTVPNTLSGNCYIRICDEMDNNCRDESNIPFIISNNGEFTVTNTDDSGLGSLRWAVEQANNNKYVLDRIEFNIPGSGPHTIQPDSALPWIRDAIFIDGYTQPGASPNTNPVGQGLNMVLKVVLDGSNADGTNGIVLVTGCSTIRGLVVHSFDHDGISLRYPGGCVIEGNFIGTDVNGITAKGNGRCGILIDDSPYNTIGWHTPEARNLISGNGESGIAIMGSGSKGNLMLGNLIGTDVTGTNNLGNYGVGIDIFSGSSANTIGGNDSGAGNIISSNNNFGVLIYESNGNEVLGNYIGIDFNGNPLSNGTHGIQLDMASDNIIGIGNIIAFNGGSGICVNSNTSINNHIHSNSIFSNNDMGIDLGTEGVTANDQDDVDTGPNNLQNFPEITSVLTVGNSITIEGILNSTPNSTFTLDFYTNDMCDASNYGEGETFIGSSVVSTNSSGDANFSISISTPLSEDQFITATATDENDNTSEFSECVQVEELCDISIISPNGGESSYMGENLDINWTSTNTSGNVTIEYSTDGGAQWQTVVASTPDDGSYQWNIPDTPSENCVVKICDEDYHICCDVSDEPFSIVIDDRCILLLLSPNGGENWYVSGNRMISWGSTNTSGNVKIEYSTNGGSGWQTIISSTPDDGSHQWTVPDVPSENCLVKISDVEDNSCYDVSDGAFAIADVNGIVVTNTNDSGPGSFRQAISDANEYPGLDLIIFDIPGSGPHTIQPDSELTYIEDPVVIDGYSQSGSQCNSNPVGQGLNTVLKIVIDGSNAGGAGGIVIVTGGSTIRGLVINNFSHCGMNIYTEGNNVIEGNFIGTDATGTSVNEGNSWTGIEVYTSNNTIGGITPEARNLISGNIESGLRILGSGNRVEGNLFGTDIHGTSVLANGNGLGTGHYESNNITRNVISGNDGSGIILNGSGTVVEGNFIGVDITGMNALANTGPGIEIENSTNNKIGGTEPGARNIISGNNAEGILLYGTGTTGNLIQGNFIGTDATGRNDLGNDYGVNISAGANNNVIGGTETGAGNVISGNTGDGVLIAEGESTHNTVLGNLIGTDIDGMTALPNTDNGIQISDSPDNVIGGTEPGARNIISGNGLNGIFIRSNEATGNLIQGNFIGTNVDGDPMGNDTHGIQIDEARDNTIGINNVIAFNGGSGVCVCGNSSINNLICTNSIFSNDALGIDLEGGSEDTYGTTANDFRDNDTGPNNLQNSPVVSLVTSNDLIGTLNSTPNVTFRLEFFANDQCDPSGHGEGRIFLGSQEVSTDGNGDAIFVESFSHSISEGQFISVTATDANNNTSEFSTYGEAVEMCEITITTPNGGETGCAGQLGTITWTSYGTSGKVQIEYSTDGGTHWNNITSSTPDNGYYPWTLPNTPSLNCVVGIYDTKDAECFDRSDGIFRISGCEILEIVTEDLPNGATGVQYNETLTAVGGMIPYFWFLVAGSLPPGLSYDNVTGIISGRPDSIGTFCFVIEVQDMEGATDEWTFCITVTEYTGTNGDPNFDGEINILDVLATVNHILGTVPLSEDVLPWADCNGDGVVNVLDALGIVNVILGIGECSPALCKHEVSLPAMKIIKSLRQYLSAREFSRLMALIKAEFFIPEEHSLAQNYPNPFNPSTDIRYQIADDRYPSPTTLKIYNILGQEVRTLVDEIKEPGYYTVTWDGSNGKGIAVASGIYFYRLTVNSDQWVETKRMVLMK